jgi:radical SAM superfamily enzyme YgiQ (UPF0313 family)
MRGDYAQYIESLKSTEGNPFGKFADPRAAVCFPNDYSIATANMGFASLASVFAPRDGFERFFYFRRFPEMAGRSFETGRLLKEFALIAFTFPYEFDLINFFRMIHGGGVEVGSKRLLIAGGAAVSLNPKPFAPFFDLLFLGCADSFWDDFFDAVGSFDDIYRRKQNILETLKPVRGVYVPGYGTDKPRIQISRGDELLDIWPQITNPKAHFSDSILIDLCRGCRFKCHFCASGYLSKKPVYRGIGMHDLDRIDTGTEAGARKLGLIGSIVSDHPRFADIIEYAASRKIELGISSLRVDALDDRLLRLLFESGVRGLTIAPETGSDRLRMVCGKKISGGQFIEMAKRIGRIGFKSIKLYFMIGLPTEEEDDIRYIGRLCREIKKAAGKTRVTASVSVFTPKPHTPFQFARFITKKEYGDKTAILKKFSGNTGIKFTMSGYREAFISALMSLGDERVGHVLKSYALESKNPGRQLKEYGIDIDTLLHSEKDLNYDMPFDDIETEIPKPRLYDIYRRSI